MRVTILGGTGRTGRALVAQALAAGHEVTVLARRPDALDDAKHAGLSVRRGDATDAEAVAAAVAGAEGVASCLGPSKDSPDGLLETAARHVVAGMEAHGARRLVWLTGAGVRAPQDRPKPVDRAFGLALRVAARKLYADSVAAADVIRGTVPVEWVIVRAPRLVDGGPTGSYRTSFVGPESGVKATRGDVAAAMLAALASDDHLRSMPVVTTL